MKTTEEDYSLWNFYNTKTPNYQIGEDTQESECIGCEKYLWGKENIMD